MNKEEKKKKAESENEIIFDPPVKPRYLPYEVRKIN